MFLIRVLFMPMILLTLLLTALIEFMKVDSDWNFWKDYNEVSIKLLPWARYKNDDKI